MMRALLDRIWRIPSTGSAFVLFFTGGALLSYVLLPLARLRPGSRLDKARRCRRLVSSSWVLFLDYMRVLGLVRYDPRATRFVLPDGPFVLVANHPTLIDVTAIVAAIPDVAIVAKPILFRSPLIGRLLRSCDHIRSGEGAFSGAAVVEQALDHLRAGTSVLIFPEGTRSPRRSVGALQPGAFEIAARAGVPVVTALIRCEPPTLMRDEPWYAVPDRTVELTVEQLRTLIPAPGDGPALASALQVTYRQRVEAPTAGAC